MSKELTCEERIDENWDMTRDQIRGILDARDQIEKLNETCLSWDTDIHEDYKSLCFSWGGPADYIRYYHDGRISYVFQDWFDGAENFLSDSDYDIAKRLYLECLDF